MSKKYNKDYFDIDNNYSEFSERFWEREMVYELPIIEFNGPINTESLSNAREELNRHYQLFNSKISNELDKMKRNGANIMNVGKIKEKEFDNSAGNRILSVRITYTKNEEIIEREREIRKSLFGENDE